MSLLLILGLGLLIDCSAAKPTDKNPKRMPAQSFLVNPGKELKFDPLEHQGGDDVRTPDGTNRNAMAHAQRWTDAVVPYVIDYEAMGKIYDGNAILQSIQQAIEDFNQYTCVKWVERKDELDYVNISPIDGCYSTTLGREGGPQALSLGSGCGSKGIVIHEMLHILGFHHEQARSDRDDFVQVLQQNIVTGEQINFQKLDPSEEDRQNQPYDYLSIMHYGLTAFSKNDQPTMKLTKGNEEWQTSVGQRRGFSSTDINEVNHLYNCPNKEIATLDCSKDKYAGSWCTQNESYCAVDWVAEGCPKTCKACDIF